MEKNAVVDLARQMGSMLMTSHDVAPQDASSFQPLGQEGWMVRPPAQLGPPKHHTTLWFWSFFFDRRHINQQHPLQRRREKKNDTFNLQKVKGDICPCVTLLYANGIYLSI